MTRPIGYAVVMVCLIIPPAQGQILPQAEDVNWPHLREHCRLLLKGLDNLKTPLPVETRQALQELLARESADPVAAATAMQKLLDAHCLVGVTINPESRVKAARGPAPAELKRDQPSVVLVKVQNDGGVTHALTVTGTQLLRGNKQEEDRWLEAEVVVAAPLAKKLSGQRVEYVVLRLTPRESGKREATFKFDVGQGTQDLGFRAEVPILFTVRTP
jgi:hypothetical protein